MTTATTPPDAPHNCCDAIFYLQMKKTTTKHWTKRWKKRKPIHIRPSILSSVRLSWDCCCGHWCCCCPFTMGFSHLYCKCIYPTEIELMLQFWITCLKANDPDAPIYIYLYHTCAHTWCHRYFSFYHTNN